MGETAAKRGALGETLLVGFIQRQNGALTSKPVIDRSEITRDTCGSSGPPLLSAVGTGLYSVRARRQDNPNSIGNECS